MEENKKYYMNLSLQWLTGFLVLLTFLLSMQAGVFDSNEVDPLHNIFMWIMIVILSIGFIINIFAVIQVRRKKAYLYYEGTTLYFHTILGKTLEYDLTKGFKVKSRKDDVYEINILGDNGKTKMYLNKQYNVDLNKFKDLLEKINQ